MLRLSYFHSMVTDCSDVEDLKAHLQYISTLLHLKIFIKLTLMYTKIKTIWRKIFVLSYVISSLSRNYIKSSLLQLQPHAIIYRISTSNKDHNSNALYPCLYNILELRGIRCFILPEVTWQKETKVNYSLASPKEKTEMVFLTPFPLSEQL